MAERPEWLPDRWTLELRRRRDGKIDKYFIDPENIYQFRSKIEVIHYLETGVLKNKATKRLSGNIKLPSSNSYPSPGAVVVNNEGATERHLPHGNATSSYEKMQGHSDGLPSEFPVHNPGVVGRDCRENQSAGQQGTVILPQDEKPDQVVGEPRPVLANTNTNTPDAVDLMKQNGVIERKSLKIVDMMTSEPVKRRFVNHVPVRRSPRNIEARMNASAEADLVSHFSPNNPSVLPCKQMAAELPENGVENKQEYIQVSRLAADEPVSTDQAVPLQEQSNGLSKENQLEPTQLNSSGSEHKSRQPEDTASFNEFGVTQNSGQACKKDLEILEDITSTKFATSSKIKSPEAVRADAEITKATTGRLLEHENKPVLVAVETTNLETESHTEKDAKSTNQSHEGQTSSDTKTKKPTSGLRRRSSRRLAGISVNPAFGTLSEPSASSGSGAAPTAAPILINLVDDEQPMEIDGAGLQLGTASADIEQKNAESSISYPFGDTWPDPCIEFAFRMLTGDLPIFEEAIAIENFFHQHLSSAKTCRPSSPPSFTHNTVQPETPIQLDNLGKSSSNAARINQECNLKNGLESSDMNGRFKRAKSN